MDCLVLNVINSAGFCQSSVEHLPAEHFACSLIIFRYPMNLLKQSVAFTPSSYVSGFCE